MMVKYVIGVRLYELCIRAIIIVFTIYISNSLMEHNLPRSYCTKTRIPTTSFKYLILLPINNTEMLYYRKEFSLKHIHSYYSQAYYFLYNRFPSKIYFLIRTSNPKLNGTNKFSFREININFVKRIY